MQPNTYEEIQNQPSREAEYNRLSQSSDRAKGRRAISDSANDVFGASRQAIQLFFGDIFQIQWFKAEDEADRHEGPVMAESASSRKYREWQQWARSGRLSVILGTGGFTPVSGRNITRNYEDYTVRNILTTDARAVIVGDGVNYASLDASQVVCELFAYFYQHEESRSNKLKQSIVQFTYLGAILLVLLASPTRAQGEQQWTNPDLSAYRDLPIDIKVGLRIDQITHVNQKSENFGAVGYLRMEWHDPNLTFEPIKSELPVRRYERSAFTIKSDEENIFYPRFTIFNQQGRRIGDDAVVAVFPDGRVLYGERFTVTLQAPDFDFLDFPFDVQRFFVSIDTPFPETIMQFVPDPKFSGLGEQLGEEEWVFNEGDVKVTSRKNIADQPANRITFEFTAYRHIWYYVLRIFVPLIIIVVVSWVTFFLKDFSKRVDISAGNLLVYVAFNFTISNDLPRLGYMTFMDAILVATFTITSLAVVLNVVLRRLEVSGRERIARAIDNYTLWVYPSAYILIVYFALRYFFPSWQIGHLLGLG